MRCIHCGAPFEGDDRFCPNCGSPVTVREAAPPPAGAGAPAPGKLPCGQCHAPNDPDDAFCFSCGAPLRAAAGEQPSAPARKLPVRVIAVAAAVVLVAGVAVFGIRALMGPPALDEAYYDYAAGRYEETIGALEQAGGAASDDAQLLQVLADCYLRTGQQELALQTLQRLELVEPTDNVRAAIESLQGRYAQTGS